MPSRKEVEDYVEWFAASIVDTFGAQRFEVSSLVCDRDLNELSHPVVQAQENSHLWRFHPHALVSRLDKQTGVGKLHVLTCTSSAISLKDIGIARSYISVLDAGISAIFSPKGISNEVRLLQADSSVRNRLFTWRKEASLVLLHWEIQNKAVLKDAIIPIESSELLLSHRFQ